jgi:hypothetical protein
MAGTLQFYVNHTADRISATRVGAPYFVRLEVRLKAYWRPDSDFVSSSYEVREPTSPNDVEKSEYAVATPRAWDDLSGILAAGSGGLCCFWPIREKTASCTAAGRDISGQPLPWHGVKRRERQPRKVQALRGLAVAVSAPLWWWPSLSWRGV